MKVKLYNLKKGDLFLYEKTKVYRFDHLDGSCAVVYGTDGSRVLIRCYVEVERV